MQPYYSDLLEQACQRTKESTLRRVINYHNEMSILMPKRTS